MTLHVHLLALSQGHRYLPIQLLAPQSWLLDNRNGLFPPPGASCIGLLAVLINMSVFIAEVYASLKLYIRNQSLVDC